MLLFFVVLYLLITIPASIIAAKRSRTSKDYVLAGRHLPFMVVLATAFATWFGSDSLMGAGSAMAEGGFMSVMTDPFGAALCLILVGVFFVPKLYPLNHLTIGDYFAERYNKTIAMMLSLAIILTYFGWTAAQFVAIGLVLNILAGIPVIWGMVIAAVFTVIYTYIGGMWSVSLNDTIQMGMILIGMIAVTAELIYKFGFGEIIAATPPEFFHLSPAASDGGMKEWLAYLAAWITIGLGSIPQQDVYQRTMSAKSMKISQWATISAGFLYLFIVMMPLFFGLVARVLYPELLLEGADPQLLIPTLVINNISFVTQVIFLGALIAAVKSTASAAILAPASLLAENVVKPFFGEMTDHVRLRLIRYSIVVVAAIALLIAIKQGNIFEIVASSYSITLVAAFVPLAAGLYWKKANEFGALLAILFGAFSWQYLEHFGGDDPVVPSIIVGLIMSAFGMCLGVMLTHVFRKKNSTHSAHAS